MSPEPRREHDFLRACRGEPVDRTPLWIMRQAGRYLPSYRSLRERATFLELCHDPDLVAEATLLPFARYDLDAAIIFSDLTIPLEAMGLGLHFDPAPVLDRPLRTAAAVEALAVPDPEQATPYLAESVRRTVRALNGRAPLIGFAGAPFTLGCYAIEGKGSKTWATVKRLAWAEPTVWDQLMGKLADTSVAFLATQVAAGCDAVQLFDSWAGVLSRHDYARYALPWVRRVAAQLAPLGVPIIYFAPDNAQFLDLLVDLPVQVIGLDWRQGLDRAASVLGPHRCVQGNLDPTVLLAGETAIRQEARRVLQEGRGCPGHVFNLGHGILPETPPEALDALVDEVHRFRPGNPRS